MYETNKSENYDLHVLKNLMNHDISTAILYVKKWIARDERVRRKDTLDNALWLSSKARKVASKLKNLLEECLFQQRLTNLLKGINKHYEKNLITLRKLAAKLSK